MISPFRPRLFLLALISVAVLPILWLLIVETLDYYKMTARAIQVRERVHLGMNIDEAITLLKKDGFMVGDKQIVPGSRHNCKLYKVDVSLSDGITPVDTFKYTVGISSNKQPYMWLTALLDGKIVKISREP